MFSLQPAGTGATGQRQALAFMAVAIEQGEPILPLLAKLHYQMAIKQSPLLGIAEIFPFGGPQALPLIERRAG